MTYRVKPGLTKYQLNQMKPSANAIRTAKRRIADAKTIGWKALADSWQKTLDELLK